MSQQLWQAQHGRVPDIMVCENGVQQQKKKNKHAIKEVVTPLILEDRVQGRFGHGVLRWSGEDPYEHSVQLCQFVHFVIVLDTSHK